MGKDMVKWGDVALIKENIIKLCLIWVVFKTGSDGRNGSSHGSQDPVLIYHHWFYG